MAAADTPELFQEQAVTDMLEMDGKLFVVENVPARVSVQTGEQLLFPDTVERLPQTVWERKTPVRVLETPVFEFAARRGGHDQR